MTPFGSLVDPDVYCKKAKSDAEYVVVVVVVVVDLVLTGFLSVTIHSRDSGHDAAVLAVAVR
jgi:hypothetical protein